MTDLDQAHAAMEASAEDDQLRLRFYERLADTELYLLLSRDPVGDDISPDLFEVEDQTFALVFDREDRLSEFVGRTAPYVGLSGRALARMITGQGIGLGLNLDVAPSAMLIPAQAVDWLVATLAQGPQEAEARPVEVFAPKGVPEAVLIGLDRKLATAAGLARFVWLAGVRYDSGQAGHMVAFVDTAPGAEPALAAAVGEALTFSGVEAGALDVVFLSASDPVAGQLARVGLRFDLPEPSAPAGPAAPGMNPDQPPKLR